MSSCSPEIGLASLIVGTVPVIGRFRWRRNNQDCGTFGYQHPLAHQSTDANSAKPQMIAATYRSNWATADQNLGSAASCRHIR